MKKNQIITISICAVGGVALVAAAFVLYRGYARFSTARAELEISKRKLAAFYQEAVFPSLDNVQLETTNTTQLTRWFDDLSATLRQGNVVSSERSPSAFKTVYLAKAIERLVQDAQAGGTELPEDFGFGFEQYAGTPTLPQPDDVPRLMEQLILVSRICKILFTNQAKSLTMVGRAVFEEQSSAVASATATPQAPPPPAPTRRTSRRTRNSASTPAPAQPKAQQPGIINEGAIFGKYRFTIEFSAKESSLIGVLNALAATRSFSVVKVMRLNKDLPVLMPVVPPPGGSGFGGVAATPAPVLRLGPSYPISGIELEIPMQVRLEIDVYKFRGDTDESGE